MEQKHRADLLKIIGRIYETPSIIDEHWHTVPPLLAELTATAPQGYEGMATMISRHFNNANKFNDLKVKKFELESGLLMLKRYLQKLQTFDKR
jgi:hypothetical protein